MGGWPYPQVPTANPTSTIDLYYRQAAAAAALQKPLPYRIYPGAPGLTPLSIPGPSAAQFPHLNTTSTNSLTTLSNYCSTNSSNSHDSRRSPSPTLNPGSPEGRSESNSQSDNEDTIQVWNWMKNEGISKPFLHKNETKYKSNSISWQNWEAGEVSKQEKVRRKRENRLLALKCVCKYAYIKSKGIMVNI